MRGLFTRKLGKIIAMEFRLTAANKAFVIITILGPFLIVALSVLPSMLSMNASGEDRDIGVIGASVALLGAISPGLEQSRIHVTRTSGTVEELDQAVLDGEIMGYLLLPSDLVNADTLEFVTSASGDWQAISVIQGVIGSTVVSMRLVERGLDPGEIGRVMRQPQVETKRLTKGGEKEQQDFMTAMFTGLAFTFLLYMTVLLYGQAIGRSVVTEKTSKTVEIMLSSVHPRDLLFGKILGKAVAALLQYAVWILMAVVLLQILGPLVDFNLTIAGGGSTIGYLVLFFLLAFLLYSCAYAALGAASEDEQHLSQLAWPLIAFLVVPMVMIGAIVTNPDGTIPRVLSLFPPTAPIVMFQRIAIGSPAAWEVALSIGLTVLTMVGVVLVSARVFRVGILMSGKRFKIGEVLKWVRYR